MPAAHIQLTPCPGSPGGGQMGGCCLDRWRRYGSPEAIRWHDVATRHRHLILTGPAPVPERRAQGPGLERPRPAAHNTDAGFAGVLSDQRVPLPVTIAVGMLVPYVRAPLPYVACLIQRAVRPRTLRVAAPAAGCTPGRFEPACAPMSQEPHPRRRSRRACGNVENGEIWWVGARPASPARLRPRTARRRRAGRR